MTDKFLDRVESTCFLAVKLALVTLFLWACVDIIAKSLK